MRTPSLALGLCVLASCATRLHPQDAAATAQELDPALLAGLEARSIGPAAMSGRIGAVASVPGDPAVIWVGAASGGVWKSTDGGLRFEPVFDDQDCTSVGAIAIDPRSPEVVWVGTGEGNPRNSVSVGRGVYRTRDGGRSWQRLGLEQTERIHRVLLHPTAPDVAFAAVLGSTWADSEHRGVYRTRDGGRTWDKVLYVDERTGCCDLVIDPQNPDKLFAGMWDHRRQAWTFRSGGPGSGLYRSLDGGSTWQRLLPHEGIPEGDLGRSSFAVCDRDPSVVYALVEAKKSALLRSDDGGFRFRTVNDQDDVASRPFYFCDIRVDPHDSNRLYNLKVAIDVSTDGGRTFTGLVGGDAAHPDHHAMWIDPLDARRIVIGNDGGVYLSLDRGHSWRFCANLPLAQFYHVAVDDDVPYHVYGGLQDNGSWRGPSSVWENGGIRNLHWQEVCFGDGFATLPDPLDSRQGYAMSQGGSLIRFDLRTGQRKSIQPPAPEGVELRFHWNSAIAQDPADPRTIYYGSQFVHRSTDRGESWTVISPDLTSNDPAKQKQDQSGGLSIDVTGAENHCTILSIAPSAVRPAVIWVGTDDGRVQVTQDGGQAWTSVEGRIPDLPANTWCPHIEPGCFQAGTAFAVFDDHRRANWKPYVYRTDDFGQTWTSLATAQLDGYCLAIEQDPVQKDLLWLGTEFGLYVTFDGGQRWHRWRHGVPACSAMAIATHRRAGDLIVATHGRSIYVLDDITPLRTLTPELLASKLHLFPVQDAILWTSAQTPAERFPGHGEFRGENRERGALLSVIANASELAHPDEKTERERKSKQAADKAKEPAQEPAAAAEAKKDEKGPPKDQVTVEVRDREGVLVRTFREPVKLGLNRIRWRLERDGQPGPSRDYEADAPEVPPAGRLVLPGDYELTVRFQGEEQRQRVRVLADPRVETPLADRQQKDAALARREAIEQQLRAAAQRLARSKRDAELVRQRLQLEPKPAVGADDPHKPLRDALAAFDKAFEEADEALWGKKVQGVARNRGLVRRTTEQLGKLTGTPDAPNPTELLALDRAAARVADVQAAVDTFSQGPLATFGTAVANSGLALAPAGGMPK